jgi:hypothetical protein
MMVLPNHNVYGFGSESWSGREALFATLGAMTLAGDVAAEVNGGQERRHGLVGPRWAHRQERGGVAEPVALHRLLAELLERAAA